MTTTKKESTFPANNFPANNKAWELILKTEEGREYRLRVIEDALEKGLSYRDVARMVGLTRQRVFQIANQAALTVEEKRALRLGKLKGGRQWHTANSTVRGPLATMDPQIAAGQT